MSRINSTRGTFAQRVLFKSGFKGDNLNAPMHKSKSLQPEMILMNGPSASQESIQEVDESDNVSDRSDIHNSEEDNQFQGQAPVDMFMFCCDWESARDHERQAYASDENFSDSCVNHPNHQIKKG